jgi:hypothetical protein
MARSAFCRRQVKKIRAEVLLEIQAIVTANDSVIRQSLTALFDPPDKLDVEIKQLVFL